MSEWFWIGVYATLGYMAVGILVTIIIFAGGFVYYAIRAFRKQP